MQKIPAKVLVVDDDADILTAARVVLRQRFETVVTEQNHQKLNALLAQNRFDVILLDMNFLAGRNSGNEGLFWLKKILEDVPNQKIILITAYGDIQLAVEGMKMGAADFIVKPWENEKLMALVTQAYEYELKKGSNTKSKLSIGAEEPVIGPSPAMEKVLQTIRKVATTDANILLLGENGTGKELIANYIHSQSLRRRKPFVKVDVGSLSETLFESELFGHRKGAFTDAREDRVGRFQSAERGTLFLDEIGNLPLPLQIKLLAVLQNRLVTPVGTNEGVPIDVRLISATNLNIHESVSLGQFREDLLYRINTIEIILPPLRERKADIPFLINHFIAVYCSRYNKPLKSISDAAVLDLEKYVWPGNVRELQHAVERAVIMSDDDVLEKSNFLLSSGNSSVLKEAIRMDELERNAILQSISRNEGNMTKVAKELGLGRTTLYRKMEKYGISKE
jgi:two-component system, NtrC family, response regulator HydG